MVEFEPMTLVHLEFVATIQIGHSFAMKNVFHNKLCMTALIDTVSDNEYGPLTK